MGASDVQAEPSAEDRSMPRPVPGYGYITYGGDRDGRHVCVRSSDLYVCMYEAGRAHGPRMEVTMNWEPALAVMSARFSRLAKELWMAAREAEAERKQTFLPV